MKNISVLGREYELAAREGTGAIYAALYDDIYRNIHRLVIFAKPGVYSISMHGPGYTYTSDKCNTVSEALRNIEARIRAAIGRFSA